MKGLASNEYHSICRGGMFFIAELLPNGVTLKTETGRVCLGQHKEHTAWMSGVSLFHMWTTYSVQFYHVYIDIYMTQIKVWLEQEYVQQTKLFQGL